MRNGQKRMRGRGNHRKSQNPMTRVYESNGPDVKIRGTASHIAEKYIQLARDAQSSGDPVAAENYYQHAEHYFRLIAAAQEQFRQQNPLLQSAAARPAGRRRRIRRERGRRSALSRTSRALRRADRSRSLILPRDAQPFPPREQPVRAGAPASRSRPKARMSAACRLSSPAASRSRTARRTATTRRNASTARGAGGPASHRRRRRHRGGFRSERGERRRQRAGRRRAAERISITSLSAGSTRARFAARVTPCVHVAG